MIISSFSVLALGKAVEKDRDNEAFLEVGDSATEGGFEDDLPAIAALAAATSK